MKEDGKKKELMEVLEDYFETGNLKANSVFNKDKLDSFEKMNLLVLLEEYSDQELSIIELFECNFIGDIIELCLK